MVRGADGGFGRQVNKCLERDIYAEVSIWLVIGAVVLCFAKALLNTPWSFYLDLEFRDQHWREKTCRA